MRRAAARIDTLSGMKKKLSILVVEDEPAILDGLLDVLVYHGYAVDSATTGSEGLQKAESGAFDLLLLDVMLPGIDGFEICDRVRQQDREQAIIMLTAKSDDADIIEGLKLGADDYVSKPFSIQQLMLRIEAVLRRTRAGELSERLLELPGMSIDTVALSGQAGDREVSFTRREMDLLCYLAAQHHRPVSRAELLNKVWGYAEHLDIDTRTIDIHVAKLRRKIEADPAKPSILTTVRGAGYQLTVETER